MKLRVTLPDGEPKDYAFTAAENMSMSAMFALQRATGLVMPKGLQKLQDDGDILTLTWYTAWMILWQAGDRVDLETLFQSEVELVTEAGDVPAETTEDEEDPTAAPTASDRGESVAAE